MTYTQLLELLKMNEHTHLDFKSQYGNNGDFVHDILCMANVLGEKSRYLVYGVNDQKEVRGLDLDQRKKLNDIVDTLRGARLSFIPHLELVDIECPENKHVQVLKIHGDSYKPYWVTQDYSSHGTTVRAGAIYCRIGDRNIGIKESTPEKLVESMFRERFGLDKSPLERFKIYIRDHINWKYDRDTHGSFYYYVQFPEFTIRRIGQERELEKFFEPWTLLFPDQKAFRYEYEVRYHATKLLSYYEVSCDGGRYQTMMPETKSFNLGTEVIQTFFFDRSRIQFDIHEMIQAVEPSLDNRSTQLYIPEFDTREDAESTIRSEFESGRQHFPFYVFDKTVQAYCKIQNGKKEEIYLGPSCPEHLRKK